MHRPVSSKGGVVARKGWRFGTGVETIASLSLTHKVAARFFSHPHVQSMPPLAAWSRIL